MMRKMICATLLTLVLGNIAAQQPDNGGKRPTDFDLTESTIVYDHRHEQPTIGKVAQLLSDDVERVTDRKPRVVTSLKQASRCVVLLGTADDSDLLKDLQRRKLIDLTPLKGQWEQWLTVVVERPYKHIDRMLVVAGSDRRGVAYGAFSLSEQIGVSPFYWWADVPVRKQTKATVAAQLQHSTKPSVKYRGIFINDEDWGLKPWASTNYERRLGDIGPKTYAQVCELILRLKGNMLAPAMHSCTGAFYSHPESKLVADSFGIIITTSHCEPLLLNNAAQSEWNQETDGDWNYKTNAQTIRRKWDDRLSEASRFENIYTMAMRGIHDAGLRGNLPMSERVSLLSQVINDQREMLRKHKVRSNAQIFVPYKETMDVYENGLQVPDDVTLVWVDDNYGYMKRVASPQEQQRSGRHGVYYHLSYLGAPHDYLWLNTTPPVLMYLELKKAFDHGADRYWLLNVGDIKPMELGIKTFFDMAWQLDSFDANTINRHQARFLASLFGRQHESLFQQILDTYYRLAWTRKPEFMGYEREWDEPAYTGLHDTEFSFRRGDAQQRLADYNQIAGLTQQLMQQLSPAEQSSLFELLGYPVLASEQMNRKFLMAQLNHEYSNRLQGEEANWAAQHSQEAFDSIATLTDRYNTQLDGKWRGMMKLAPGWNALYQLMPALNLHDMGQREPLLQPSQAPTRELSLSLSQFSPLNGDDVASHLISGIGSSWQVLHDGDFSLQLPSIDADTLAVQVSIVPFWPLYPGCQHRCGVSIDGQPLQTANHQPKEYSLQWKDEVLRNAAVFTFRFPIDRHQSTHRLLLSLPDPGVKVQSISCFYPLF